MILGQIAIDTERGTIDTHRDSYKFDMVSVVSVRRPFFFSGGALAVGLAAFAWAFSDLLYPHELTGIASASMVLAVAGVQIAQLKLLSRDLRGSELSDAVWGQYGQLNAIRRKIAWAITSSRKESS